MITRLSGEVGEPRCLWLMRRGAGGTSDAVQILAAWITRFGRLCGSEAAVVCNVIGGKTCDDDFLVSSCNRLPLIIQHSYACGRQEPEVLGIHHPLVIAEGEKGRGDGGAGTKEGENVGLGSHRTRIIFWPATVQHISSDTDEGRGVVTERCDHRCGVCIMHVTQQRQGCGAAWKFVGCLFRRGSPPIHPILPSGKVHSKFYWPGSAPAVFLPFRRLRPPSFLVFII